MEPSRSQSPLRRRDLIALAAGFSVLPSVPRAADAPPATSPEGPFDAPLVRRLAHELSQKPFNPPTANLPPSIANVDYDQYRSIRFQPAKALWADDKSGFFKAEFFHLGFLYKQPVEIFEVVAGQSKRIRYSPAMFTFDNGVQPPPDDADLDFAGFRLHAPFVKPDYADEVCAFVGASYFRAVAKGQGYGLSARGLAIDTAEPSGEEFPLFRAFWLEKPAPGARSMVVDALLDSASVASAFRFTIRPGEETVFDVECVHYPRKDIAVTGIAPLTSMYMFDAINRAKVDDYRPAVHDSEAYSMLTSRGEQIWRPLNNPADLQISLFTDTNVRGFGLLQRKRSFFDYEDLEARYEMRPSCWVEPIGDWGDGGIELVEIPSPREVHDNVVAFWRPKAPLKAQGEYGYVYRLHWCWSPPAHAAVAKVASCRSGIAWDQKGRLFVIDFESDPKTLAPDAKPDIDVGTNTGKIQNAVAQFNPETKGWRLSFELMPDGKMAEMHARLVDPTGPLTETWIYRWTA